MNTVSYIQIGCCLFQHHTEKDAGKDAAMLYTICNKERCGEVLSMSHLTLLVLMEMHNHDKKLFSTV